MGKEIVVESMEEMCDLMCGNKLPEKKRYWIFTFGCGMEHGGHYVKIYGTFDSARAKMVEKFGDKWCWQYAEEKWNEYVADPNRKWKAETQLEDNGGIEMISVEEANENCWNTGVYNDACDCELCQYKDECSGYDGEEDDEEEEDE